MRNWSVGWRFPLPPAVAVLASLQNLGMLCHCRCLCHRGDFVMGWETDVSHGGGDFVIPVYNLRPETLSCGDSVMWYRHSKPRCTGWHFKIGITSKASHWPVRYMHSKLGVLSQNLGVQNLHWPSGRSWLRHCVGRRGARVNRVDQTSDLQTSTAAVRRWFSVRRIATTILWLSTISMHNDQDKWAQII